MEKDTASPRHLRTLPVLVSLCLLALAPCAPAHATDFPEVQTWLEENQPIDLDTSCSVLSKGGTKAACRLLKFPEDALLVGTSGQRVLVDEAATIDVLEAAGVPVPAHGTIFDLTVVSFSKGIPQKPYPCMLETWIDGTEIQNNLRDFNSMPKDFWATTLGQAATAEGVGVAELQSATVASLQAYLSFVQGQQKYVVDVEMFMTSDGTVVLVDLAGGFGARSSRVKTWTQQLTNAIQSINSLDEGVGARS